MSMVIAIRMGTGTAMTMTTDALSAEQFQRLATWFSPSFPIGGYSYSHGLEAAFEAELVADRAGLIDWLEGLLAFGSARNDAILFVEAYRAYPDITDVAETAAALSPSAELRAETLNQGQAFLRAVGQGWPDLLKQNATDPRKAEGLSGASCSLELSPEGDPGSSPVARPGIEALMEQEMVLSVAAGACCAAAAIPLKPSLTAYLHAFCANIVSAGLRSLPIGQSDGVAALAALEPAIACAANHALASSLDDLGSSTPMLDWLSATHETQYSRLFRS